MKHLILLLFLFNTVLNSQCPLSDIELSSQAEVDSFTINYPNCAEIQGNLTISNFIGNIEDLSPLNQITRIEGDFLIRANPKLKSIADFKNLKEVLGTLSIELNSNLTSITGFEKLEMVDGLRLVNNEKLLEFNFFPNLDTIRSNLNVFVLVDEFNLNANNEIYTEFLSLNGNIKFDFSNRLIGLKVVDISMNQYIGSLDSLYSKIPYYVNNIRINDKEKFSFNGIGKYDSLKSIRFSDIDDLIFNENIVTSYAIELSLRNCNGFQNLDNISNIRLASIFLSSLSQLSNVNSFSDLSELESLSISNCENITSIIGFESAFNIKEVFISSNESLSECAIEPICNAISEYPENIIIRENLNQCENVDSVAYNCTTSIIEELENSNFKIIPNPASHTIAIDISYPKGNYHSLRIINSIGKTIKILNPNEKHIKINELNNGHYFLILSSQKQVIAIPFSKI